MTNDTDGTLKKGVKEGLHTKLQFPNQYILELLGKHYPIFLERG